jgi:hypothetical protein
MILVNALLYFASSDAIDVRLLGCRRGPGQEIRPPFHGVTIVL